jgi:hypothetical protein
VRNDLRSNTFRMCPTPLSTSPSISWRLTVAPPLGATAR